MRTLSTLSVAIFSSACCVAAARLVPDGMLGQSGSRGAPVEWTDCRYCAADGAGNVYFPGGWRLRPGASAPERMSKTVSGELMSDGEALYAWRTDPGVLVRLSATDEGLADTGDAVKIGDWRRRPFPAPASCRRGFAAKARTFALDRAQNAVFAWDGTGRPLGKALDYKALVPKPDLVRAAAVHPVTGEMLLGTYWPECRVHRFREDGSERVDEAWPFAMMAQSFVCAGNRVFALGPCVRELTDSFGSSMSFGVNANEAQGLARGDRGWWVATTQGAQFYPDSAAADGVPASRRVGGLANVTALGLSAGRVLVAEGYRMYGLWLDDRRNEPLSSDSVWCAYGKWDGAVESIESCAAGGFAFTWRKGDKTESWIFEPRITEWKDRARRVRSVPREQGARRPANEDRIGRYRVVAEEKEIVLYEGQARVCAFSVSATAIAAEGKWLVAWVPKLKAVLRMKLVEK